MMVNFFISDIFVLSFLKNFLKNLALNKTYPKGQHRDKVFNRLPIERGNYTAKSDTVFPTCNGVKPHLLQLSKYYRHTN